MLGTHYNVSYGGGEDRGVLSNYCERPAHNIITCRSVLTFKLHLLHLECVSCGALFHKYTTWVGIYEEILGVENKIFEFELPCIGSLITIIFLHILSSMDLAIIIYNRYYRSEDQKKNWMFKFRLIFSDRGLVNKRFFLTKNIGQFFQSFSVKN